MTYVAFLRGINVGGNTKVAMADLRAAVEALGYNNVKTVLNSGNVVFESTKDSSLMHQEIEKKLEEIFTFPIAVQLRTVNEIKELIAANPFKDIPATSTMRCNVSFVSGTGKGTITIPYESPEKDFGMLAIISGAVCSVIDISSGRGTPEVMKILEKEFGKTTTTRTWNTMLKISALL